jgi:trehalose-6-phosphate synthase
MNMDNRGASFLGSKLHHWLRELGEAGPSIDETCASDATLAEWTPETLRLTLANVLPDAQIVVVSNREPYIHNCKAGDIAVERPASGLIAAIEPVVQLCGGTWIAHGSGTADRDVVDATDRIHLPPGSPSYSLRRVWLSEEEQDGYYHGLCNEGLWPLCHVVFVQPTFRDADWKQYRAVNALFAEAVVQEATRKDPIILVQDHHFALLPKMLRERLPDSTIITFWHNPWPNPETFGIFPWKAELIRGLLGSSVLGFHTQTYCNEFIDTVARFVESRIDREHASVAVAGGETFVRSYPLSIEWPPAGLVGQPSVAKCRASVRARLGLPPNVRLGVGIERFDYPKGIFDCLRAVENFFACNPEWLGRFVFLQVAAPTRRRIATYRNLEQEVLEAVREINNRYGTEKYQPILLIARHCESSGVFELFRAADFCVVSRLHDGMNLVAKEFVAARDDGLGVLILSEFIGASRELSKALIVNPYDGLAVADAISRALRMSEEEQRERMRWMRDVVRSRNVYRWAGQMLLDAAQLRNRRIILPAAFRS